MVPDSDRPVDWQRLTFPVDIIRPPLERLKMTPPADTDLARSDHGLQFIASSSNLQHLRHSRWKRFEGRESDNEVRISLFCHTSVSLLWEASNLISTNKIAARENIPKKVNFYKSSEFRLFPISLMFTDCCTRTSVITFYPLWLVCVKFRENRTNMLANSSANKTIIFKQCIMKVQTNGIFGLGDLKMDS